MKQLILGGARSGKSAQAEQRALDALDADTALLYIATGTAGDDEMAERIAHHQARRGAQWRLIEEPLALADVLLNWRSHTDQPHAIILVDCLTLWLSNCLHHECWDEQREALLNALANVDADVLFVSNEVGSGIVPLGALSRQFADESGRLHQALAKQCEQVTLVVAGLPLELKA